MYSRMFGVTHESKDVGVCGRDAEGSGYCRIPLNSSYPYNAMICALLFAGRGGEGASLDEYWEEGQMLSFT